jgi:hypothetical protein
MEFQTRIECKILSREERERDDKEFSCIATKKTAKEIGMKRERQDRLWNKERLVFEREMKL